MTIGKPATIKEAITLTLEAKDSCPTPGDQVNVFKDAFTTNRFFQSVLSKTNAVQLKSVSPRNNPPDTKPFVLFSLECKYPEQSR